MKLNHNRKKILSPTSISSEDNFSSTVNSTSSIWIGMAILSSVILMNIPFRLFSLRMSLRKHDYNIFKILTIFLSIPLILIFGLGGFSLVIILYLFLKYMNNYYIIINYFFHVP